MMQPIAFEEEMNVYGLYEISSFSNKLKNNNLTHLLKNTSKISLVSPYSDNKYRYYNSYYRLEKGLWISVSHPFCTYTVNSR